MSCTKVAKQLLVKVGEGPEEGGGGKGRNIFGHNFRKFDFGPHVQVSGPQFCEGQTSQGVEAVVSQGFFSGLHLELYNLAEDPGETTNLIQDQQVMIFPGIFCMDIDGG